MNEVTWVTDQELRVTALSRRLRELLGPTAASTGDVPVANLFPGEDPFQIAAVAHEWALQGQAVDFELDWYDGKYHLQIQPLHGIGGAIVAFWAPPVHAGPRLFRDSAVGTWICAPGRPLGPKGCCRCWGSRRNPPMRRFASSSTPEDSQIVGAVRADAHSKGTGYRCDHRIVRADGQTRFVREQAHIHFDEHGDAITLTGSLIDITESKVNGRVSNLQNRALIEERLGDRTRAAKRPPLRAFVSRRGWFQGGER